MALKKKKKKHPPPHDCAGYRLTMRRVFVKSNAGWLSYLRDEVDCYRSKSLEGADGILPIVWAGEGYHDSGPLVLEHVRMDLYNLSKMLRHHPKYPKDGVELGLVNVAAEVGHRALKGLKAIHNNGIIHRDLHPGNIGLTPSLEGSVAIFDFGLAKPYRDLYGRHVRDEPRPFVGTQGFASINAHAWRTLSRRDDCQPLALTLSYLLLGEDGLPWVKCNHFSLKNDMHNIYLLQMKKVFPKAVEGIMPVVFEDFLRHSMRLKFGEKPDYDEYIVRFRKEAKNGVKGKLDLLSLLPRPTSND